MQEASNKDLDLQHFHSLLTKLDKGELSLELDEAMAQCINEISDACFERGGTQKASLTLKVEFVMDQQDKIVQIYPEMQTKFPKAPKKRAAIFYCDDKGNLTRQSPNQLTFDDELERKRLRDAEKAAGM
ncbi:MAG: hypothetical protein CMP22_07665 [Rickettsiales bacterium]|nr:hypothetical protein [Rickettsiales bacterium]|tara:strand:- start:578 stop:964 length:387 start_codon:yes stop_codon:yes gene_type:complete